MRSSPIEEHQLDYDWRFAQETVLRLAEFANSATNVLLLGCPSLAPVLGNHGLSGELIERNPNYINQDKSFSVVHTDLRFEVPAEARTARFSHAFVDPPWYPQELLHWVNFALSQVENGGAVFFTLWSEIIRPTARDEHRRILAALSNVGRLEQLGVVSYRLPFFEREAFRAAGQPMAKREGLLFRLIKLNNRLLDVPAFQKSAVEWRRFTLSEEQLAILVGSEPNEEGRGQFFDVEPFTLTDTSRRNDRLKSINVWTSKNRVGRLFEPSKLADRVLAQDEASLRMLVEVMGMEFDPLNVKWGKSWRHPA